MLERLRAMVKASVYLLEYMTYVSDMDNLVEERPARLTVFDVLKPSVAVVALVGAVLNAANEFGGAVGIHLDLQTGATIAAASVFVVTGQVFFQHYFEVTAIKRRLLDSLDLERAEMSNLVATLEARAAEHDAKPRPSD